MSGFTSPCAEARADWSEQAGFPLSIPVHFFSASPSVSLPLSLTPVVPSTWSGPPAVARQSCGKHSCASMSAQRVRMPAAVTGRSGARRCSSAASSPNANEAARCHTCGVRTDLFSTWISVLSPKCGGREVRIKKVDQDEMQLDVRIRAVEVR